MKNVQAYIILPIYRNKKHIPAMICVPRFYVLHLCVDHGEIKSQTANWVLKNGHLKDEFTFS